MSLRIAKDTLLPVLNDTIKVNGTAQDITGATVTFSMRALGSVDGATPKIDDASATIVSAVAGTVRYSWAGTDTNTAGDYLGWWTVDGQDSPEFLIQVYAHGREPGHLCSLAQVRNYLQKPGEDVAQDATILNFIARASRAIHNYTGREFSPLSTSEATRIFDVGGWARMREVEIGDLAAMGSSGSPVVVLDNTGATVDSVAVADLATELQYLPLNRETFEPITRLRFRPAGPSLSSSHQVQVTGTWGWPDIPSDVEHAAVVTVGKWMRKDVQAHTSTFADDAAPAPIDSIPNQVKTMLSHYRRPGIS